MGSCYSRIFAEEKLGDQMLQCDCIACLEDPGSMRNVMLIYMMVTKDAGQRNGANRAISICKRHTDCPTHPPSLSANEIKLKKPGGDSDVD